MPLPTTLTEPELFRAMEQDSAGTMVVTSTARAARVLRQHFGQWMLRENRTGWQTPNILDWESWLETLWDSATIRGGDARLLLTNAQELDLWRQVLDRDEAASGTTAVAALAPMAQQAWRDMHRYRIPLERLRFDTHTDVQAFYGWARKLQQLCKKNLFLPESELMSAIAELAANRGLLLPRRIFLLGFDRTTPLQIHWTEMLEAQGCAIGWIRLIPVETVGDAADCIVYAADLEEEITAAALWCRRMLIADPDRQIGVVVPALQALQDRIDSTFRRLLQPSSMRVDAPQAELPYEFSLGAAMRRLPAIQTAALLLAWMEGSLPIDQVCWLATHGRFGAASAQAHEARARLDRRFRERWSKLGGPVRLLDYLAWLQSAAGGDATALLRAIRGLAEMARAGNLDRSRSFAEWREVIDELLLAVDWHLLHAEDSAGYQLLERWNRLLDELSSLTAVAGKVSFEHMLSRLQDMMAQTVFTRQSTNAPIQIMGVPESAGLVFDAVWMMNARSSAWPARGTASPFLPWNIQREAGMPYASQEEDYAFAQSLTSRILSSAKQRIVSFAVQEDDLNAASARTPSLEVLLSPLIRDAWPDAPLVSATSYLAELASTVRNSPPAGMLESVAEEDAAPWNGGKVRGGVRFLELQAACPFRAFAELRLGAQPLPDIDSGLSPATQGTAVHDVLHEFWRQVQSLANLNALSDEQCREVLRRHIATALPRVLQPADEPWQQAVLRLESMRIEETLAAWMVRERHRADFTVLATEDHLQDQEIGGVRFDCRIDRVDQVAQGIALLDYKTGSIAARSCAGDRPDQPQLPAYAVLRAKDASTALAGLAFASLHPRTQDLIVIRSLPSVFDPEPAQASAPQKPAAGSKPKPDACTEEAMREHLREWEEVLTRLSHSFRQGVAAVDPKNLHATCRNCRQSIFCRIREASLAFAEQEDADENANEESQE